MTPASAGAGLTFSAGAYNVGQNADGSIVVNADDIQIKAAYQTLLNGATSSATANTLAQRGAGGAISFGVVTCSGLTNSGNSSITGTLGVTGATTINTLNSGPSTLFSMTCTQNATVGGTLGVTGVSTLSSAVIGQITISSSTMDTAAVGGGSPSSPITISTGASTGVEFRLAVLNNALRMRHKPCS